MKQLERISAFLGKYMAFLETAANNYKYGFYNDSSSISNCLFTGLTFTSFRYAVVRVSGGSAHNLVITNCNFYATSTAGYNQTGGQSSIALGNANKDIDVTIESEIVDCDFWGCRSAISLFPGSTPVTNTIRRCTFRYNSSTIISVRDKNSYNGWRIVDCSFFRNYGTLIDFNNNSSGHTTVDTLVSNCTFTENRNKSGSILNAGAGAYSNNRIRFANCDFSGNMVSNATATILNSPIREHYWIFRDCSFRGNTNFVSSDASSKFSLMSFGGIYNYARFLNCTFVDNQVSIAPEATVSLSGTFSSSTTTGTGLYFAHSTLKDNGVSGSAITNSEIVLLPAGNNNKLAIVNSVFDNDSANYTPVLCGKEVKPYLHNSYLRGFDPATAGCTTFTRCDNISTNGEVCFARFRKSPTSVHWAQGLQAGSPYATAASDVYVREWSQAADLALIEHTPELETKKKWFSLYNFTYYSDANAASTYGVPDGLPHLPDAFGADRIAPHLAFGPLNTPLGGTIFFVR